MANFSREEAEKQKNAENGGIGALIAGVAVMAIGGAVHSSHQAKKKEKRDEIDRQIQEINREIDGYRSKFWGSTLYENEISALERKKKTLLQQREEL